MCLVLFDTRRRCVRLHCLFFPPLRGQFLNRRVSQRCFFFGGKYFRTQLSNGSRPSHRASTALKGSTSRHKETMLRPIAWHLAVCLLLFWRVSGVPLGGSGKNSELSGAAKAVDEIRVVPGFKGPLPSRHFSGFDQKFEG